MKLFKKVLALVLVVEVAIILVSSYTIKADRKEKAEKVADYWFNKYSVVAHGMGGIDGYDYTNSIEAFQTQYAAGTRVFEVDLALTSDGKLVLTHGWLEHKTKRLEMDGADRSPMTYDDFMSKKIHGLYTPMDVASLIKIMQEYPDIYVVMDWGKDLDYVEEEDKDYIFELDELIQRNQIFVNNFKDVDESLLKRVIPQIYYEEHYNQLHKVYPFENYIYTLYKNYMNTNAKAVMSFVEKNNIAVIVSNLYGDQKVITAELRRQINYDRTKSQEMGVFLHTINELEDVSGLIDEGYKGIFTDYLTQNQVEQAIGNDK